MRDTDHRAALAQLRAAVESGDTHPVTRLNLALAESRAGDTQAADAMLHALAQEHPHWPEAALRLAERHRAAGEIDAAIDSYQRVLDVEPTHVVALLALGALLANGRDPARAQILLRRRCALPDPPAEVFDALGAALLAGGDSAAAADTLRHARALAPENLVIMLRLVQAWTAADAIEAGLATIDTLCRDDPLNPVPLVGCGALLVAAGRCAAATDMLEAALALAPADADLAAAIAELSLRTGDDAETEAALRRAAALAPGNAALRANLAIVLTRLHRHASAAMTMQEMLAAHGESADLLSNLAGALACLARHDEAIAAARRATELAPGSHFAWRTLANVMAYAESVAGADMLYVLQQAGRVAPRRAMPLLQPLRTSGPLRVGLIGATLCTHPTGWLALAGLENLDPDAFALVCLAQPESSDPMQRRFRAIAAEWHVAGEDPARQARDLKLDVAIDLGGYGLRGLMVHFAERLAPVQIKWIGMQNHSSGLAEMDFFITDRWETPPALAHLYVERLLMMPDGYACYTPPPHAPEVAPTPAATRGAVTFGCFNNLAKLTARMIAVWCDILHTAPETRLILKTHQFDEPETATATCARFAQHGIGADRLELRGGSPHRALLSQYADIDIMLDPHPYSGGLTTCEALWMGVPVLTLPGETFASRHSTSHLCNVGLDNWVAADLADYRAMAIARSRDIEGLAALRAGLRARVRASPLCDAPRFGRNLGIALRQAVGEHP